MLECELRECFGMCVIWEVTSTMSSSASKRGPGAGRKKLDKAHSKQFGTQISRDMLHKARFNIRAWRVHIHVIGQDFIT